MIQSSPSWQLGCLTFNSRLIQGPLAGYSNVAFREQLWKFGGLAYACTEMLPASIVTIEEHGPNNRFTWRHPKESRLCYQLSGNQPKTLAKAAEIVTNLGADIIDLNAGCPKQKIRKKMNGSALLEQPETLAQLVGALKEATPVPITVKMRIARPESIEHTIALTQVLSAAGVDGIVIHGRHWQDDYDAPLQLEHMAAAVRHASCPVIVNGDVKDYQSYQDLLLATQATAVMVARAGFASPWLFQQILSEEQGQPFFRPQLNEIGQILWQHIQALQPFMSETSVCLQARTICRYYSRHLPDHIQDNFVRTINASEPTLITLQKLIEKAYKSDE